MLNCAREARVSDWTLGPVLASLIRQRGRDAKLRLAR